MAMSVKSFEEGLEGDAPIIAEINITPLTDVFLVLLIIFMVTSSVLSQMGIQVQLPKAQQAASNNDKPGVLVTVTKDGTIAVNGTKIPSGQSNENYLEEVLKVALSKTTDKTIVLEGDRDAVLGTVVRVMDIGKKLGATKFAVATSR